MVHVYRHMAMSDCFLTHMLSVCVLVCIARVPPWQGGAGVQGQIQEWSAYHKKCLGFVERLSVLIIGPGLGDDPQVGTAGLVLQTFKDP